MEVLVTGAGGYLGPHVVEALTNLGHDVIALGRNWDGKEKNPRVNYVAGDVLDPNFSFQQISQSTPDALIHLAWRNGFVHDNPSHIEELSAHYSFLMSAAKLGISKISVLGTMHEVGYWEGAITAETPTNPISMYGIAKDSLRRSLMRSLPNESSLRWIRSYYITGDDKRSHSIFTKLLEASDAGKTQFPFTSGTNLYDFIDVDELANQISVVATVDTSPTVINCCSGVPESLGSRVERFIAEEQLGLNLEYGAFPDRAYDSPGVWGDSTEIKNLMNHSYVQGNENV